MTLAKFILEAIDQQTRCPAEELAFSVGDVEDLKAIIDPDATERDLASGYELDAAEVDRICVRFDLSFVAGIHPVEIRAARAVDDLPYKVHTGRELRMMLDGCKPFAFFTETYPDKGRYAAPEDLFDPYVVAGLFLKREHHVAIGTCLPVERSIRYVMYAHFKEEWRMNAFVALQARTTSRGWTDADEKALGTLLGYSDSENDAFIAHRNGFRGMET